MGIQLTQWEAETLHWASKRYVYYFGVTTLTSPPPITDAKEKDLYEKEALSSWFK